VRNKQISERLNRFKWFFGLPCKSEVKLSIFQDTALSACKGPLKEIITKKACNGCGFYILRDPGAAIKPAIKQ